uniref:protein xylosyltransferase n=1 Tax=Anopheles farauti TaxID=69004 RepID=A0A182QK58_9DIPT
MDLMAFVKNGLVSVQQCFQRKCAVYFTIILSSTVLLYTIANLFILNTTPNRVISIGSFISSNGSEHLLPCVITNPYARDAIKRAVSDECKIKIAYAACKSEKGTLIPRELPYQCPRGDYVPYRPIGCFPFGTLNHESVAIQTSDNTPKLCVDMCMQRNFTYALLQNGDICYCDERKPNGNEKLDNTLCSVPCAGNSKQNCGGLMVSMVYETGLSRTPQQPIKLYPNPREQPVRIGFLLKFHKRNVRQIRRLLRAIYDKKHYYYIHVDQKQPYLHRELLKLEKDFPNIYVTRQRYNIAWGCYSLLQAMLACLKDMLSMPTWKPDFILNMSESDFPVKTVQKLTEFLSANRGRNFMKLQTIASIDRYIRDSGYNMNFVECEDHMWLIGQRKLPSGIVANGGSDWFCFSKEFVKYLLEVNNDLIGGMMNLMEYSAFSTENFFLQVLQSSHFCHTHYDNNLRLISWVSKHGCAKNRNVDWNGCSPLTIRRDSWSNLFRFITDEVFVVRKVNPIVDQLVILQMEEHTFGKHASSIPNLNAYWQNIYHHLDENHEPRIPAVLNAANILLNIGNQLEPYDAFKVLEITHYFDKNVFVGFLIRYLASIKNHQSEMEILVKPKSAFSRMPITHNRPLKEKLKNFKLEISTATDAVEKLPIDFDVVHSVSKLPILIVHLPMNEKLSFAVNHTVTVDWIDPQQRSVAIEHFNIEEHQNEFTHHPLQSTALNTPLTEGVWRAEVAVNGTAVGRINFLMFTDQSILEPSLAIERFSCPSTPFVELFLNVCYLPYGSYILQQQARRNALVQLFQIESICIKSCPVSTIRGSCAVGQLLAVGTKTSPAKMQKFPLRLIWRYKVFVLIGFMIIAAQLFLAYKLLRMPLSGNETLEERDLSRKLYEKYVKKPATEPDGIHALNLSIGGNEAKKPEKEANPSTTPLALRLDELDFVPPCKLTRKETISAIHRAKSQTCKAKIVEVACEIQAGKLYPDHLPNYCPRGNHLPNRALGCFRDEKDFRLLSGYFTTFKTNNSPERCIRLCLQSGYPFAGVQYGYECFCGDEEPKASAKLPDSSCNIKCTGDAKEACGGYFTINVYETGIRKFAAQTTKEASLRHTDESVRIVFLLTLNGRAVRQVNRLLKALYSPRHYYYIHIDARQDYLYRELLKLESRYPNIRLARRRFASIWGGASLLQMLIACMEHLLYESTWQWDFMLNLSESDFPLKTVDQLVTFLTANRDQNFVRNHGREVQRFIQKQGLDMTFVECDNRMWRIGDRSLPAGITIDGGSDWVCLSRAFAAYVTGNGDPSKRDELVQGLLRVFEYTILPAESFFHTALRNSLFCYTYTNNNLHMTNWKRQLGCKCQYRHIVDWCGCSPNNFRSEDWERLQASQKKKLFFARKFEALVNQAITLQLEEWIFGPYPADYPNLHAYWQNVYHHEDSGPASDGGALQKVAHSLLRLNARLSGVSVQLYEPQGVREITHYLDRDIYRGFLIRHEALLEDAGVPVELETWISPVVTAKVTRSTPLARRITHLEVSTDYDEKEQLSRNFARIIGTNTEPALIFRLAPLTPPSETAERVKTVSNNATNYTLAVEWIDPDGTIVTSSLFTIEDNPAGAAHTFNHFVKGNKLKQPLAEGVWSARLLHGKSLLGTTRFLVIEPTVQRSHHSHRRQVIPLPRQTRATSRVRDVRVGHSGDRHDLDADSDQSQQQQHQLDKLVAQFFTIQETCRVAGRGSDPSQFTRFVDCASTSWSSLAVDPKSDMYAESATTTS